MTDKVIEFFKKQSDAVFASQVSIDIPVLGRRSDGKVARLFPPMVRDALVASSQVDRQNREPGGSRARTQAVESAINRARRECPHLFNNEKE